MRLRRALDDSSSTASTPQCRCSGTLLQNPDIANGDYDIHWLEK
jgi:acetyl-CoA carboxylase biotin carboxylase subunit